MINLNEKYKNFSLLQIYNLLINDGVDKELAYNFVYNKVVDDKEEIKKST